MKGPSEHQIQKMFLQWIGFAYPKLWFYAVPNAAKRSVWEAARAKAEGLSSGVPDVVFPELHLYIELKTATGRLSANQIGWITHLRECGYTVLIVHGFEDAVDQFKKFMLNHNHEAAHASR